MNSLDGLGTDARQIMLEAAALVHKASMLNLIVTIERTPLKPLAMGNHEASITVYPARAGSVEAQRDALWKEELRRRVMTVPPQPVRIEPDGVIYKSAEEMHAAMLELPPEQP